MHSLRQRKVGHAVIEVPDVVPCRPDSSDESDESGAHSLRRVLTGPVSFRRLMNGAAKGYQFEGEASVGQVM